MIILIKYLIICSKINMIAAKLLLKKLMYVMINLSKWNSCIFLCFIYLYKYIIVHKLRGKCKMLIYEYYHEWSEEVDINGRYSKYAQPEKYSQSIWCHQNVANGYELHNNYGKSKLDTLYSSHCYSKVTATWWSYHDCCFMTSHQVTLQWRDFVTLTWLSIGDSTAKSSW